MTEAETRQPGAIGFPWPPLLYLGATAIAIILGVFVPLPWFVSPFSDLLFAVGFLCVLAFLLLFIQALRSLREARTPISPMHRSEHLVTSGVFAFSRNPIYLAASVLMIGIGFIGGLVWFFVMAVVASLAVQKLAIEPEERHLSVRFGKKYRDYARKVRRWI